MQTPTSKWDVERAAAWLRNHGWGDAGQTYASQTLAPQLDPALAAQADAALGAGTALSDQEKEEIDIAGWPALVAPFYD